MTKACLFEIGPFYDSCKDQETDSACQNSRRVAARSRQSCALLPGFNFSQLSYAGAGLIFCYELFTTFLNQVMPVSDGECREDYLRPDQEAPVVGHPSKPRRPLTK